MKKLRYILLPLLIITSGCSININFNSDINTNNQEENKNIEVLKSMKAIINETEYIINLEENDTVQKLVELLPISVTMNELNGNEKYVYLDRTLPTESSNPKKISTGDVMLYGNNCLVIFYKSFDTPYSYTKIGHIDNFPALGDSAIKVRFEI